MKHNVARLLFLLLVVMAMLVSACTSPTPEATEASAAEEEEAAPAAEEEEASDEPILVGWACPRSGNHAVLGEWEEKAVVMAFDEKNAEGGIHGRPLVLVKEDDEADPTKAVNIAEKLCTEDGVVAVGGFPNSTPALATLPVYTEYQVVQVVTGLNDTITQQGSQYVFRNSARGSDFEREIVEYLLDQGYTKFASMADNSAYGQGLCEYERAALEEAGLDLVVENYAGDDKDFTGQLTQILQGDPDVILLAGSEVAAGLIAKQARAMGFEGIVAGGCAVGTPKFIEVAGDAAEGAYFSSVYISPEGDPMVEDWAKRYEEKWGEAPEGHGAKAYDGAMLLIEAMDAAYPEVTGERISEEFHKICGYKGVQGEFCFDETGEGISMLHIGVIQGGELLPVE